MCSSDLAAAGHREDRQQRHRWALAPFVWRVRHGLGPAGQFYAGDQFAGTFREAVVTTIYLGVIDGWHVWEVRDDAGVVVGHNRSPAGEEDEFVPPSA